MKVDFFYIVGAWVEALSGCGRLGLSDPEYPAIIFATRPLLWG